MSTNDCEKQCPSNTSDQMNLDYSSDKTKDDIANGAESASPDKSHRLAGKQNSSLPVASSEVTEKEGKSLSEDAKSTSSGSATSVVKSVSEGNTSSVPAVNSSSPEETETESPSKRQKTDTRVPSDSSYGSGLPTPDKNENRNKIDTPSNDEKDKLNVTDPAEHGDDERGNHGLRIPLARVKKIMKADPYLSIASQDAVFLIAKATEMFIESLASEAYDITVSSKKKTVSKKDIDTIIERIEALAFLEGAVDF